MKKKILYLTLLVSFTSMAHAQSEKYSGAMQKNLAMTDSAFSNPAFLLTLSNNFERIGAAEKNQWLPYYYAAFYEVNYGFRSSDMSGADPIADKAEYLLNKADSLSPGNSEIHTVKSMISTLRMLVNPMQRYMQYGPAIATAISTAETLDPSNPRPYYLTAQSLKNTPEQFGGGCEAAMAQAKIAKEKFETFKAASPLSPNWGMSQNEMLIKDCGGK